MQAQQQDVVVAEAVGELVQVQLQREVLFAVCVDEVLAPRRGVEDDRLVVGDAESAADASAGVRAVRAAEGVVAGVARLEDGAAEVERSPQRLGAGGVRRQQVVPPAYVLGEVLQPARRRPQDVEVDVLQRRPVPGLQVHRPRRLVPVHLDVGVGDDHIGRLERLPGGRTAERHRVDVGGEGELVLGIGQPEVLDRVTAHGQGLVEGARVVAVPASEAVVHDPHGHLQRKIDENGCRGVPIRRCRETAVPSVGHWDRWRHSSATSEEWRGGGSGKPRTRPAPAMQQ